MSGFLDRSGHSDFHQPRSWPRWARPICTHPISLCQGGSADPMWKIAILTVALFAPRAQAQEFSSPEDLLSTLYRAYLSAPVTNFEPYFSDRLTAEMSGGRLGPQTLHRLGVDPIIGSHEPSLVTVFNLDTVAKRGLTATSTASFRNNGDLVTINFDLVREDAHGWQIDHISGQSGDLSWCSSDLVAAVQDVPR
jgi:hypothetical protein